MSKKNKKNKNMKYISKIIEKTPMDNPDKSLTKVVSNYVGQKGKMKGKKYQNPTKHPRETFMRGTCPHHEIGKKGYAVSRIFVNGDGTATCKICGAKIPVTLFNQNERKKTIAKLEFLNQQMKYLSVACGMQNNVQMYFGKMGGYLGFYDKLSDSVSTVADAASRKKKHKNKKFESGTSQQLGGWRNSF